MTTELQAGDKVRVKPLCAIGTVQHVSSRLRHAPYLVQVDGYGAWSYAADELQKLPENTVLTLPPPGNWTQYCGSCGAVTTGGRCPKCRP